MILCYMMCDVFWWTHKSREFIFVVKFKIIINFFRYTCSFTLSHVRMSSVMFASFCFYLRLCLAIFPTWGQRNSQTENKTVQFNALYY